MINPIAGIGTGDGNAQAPITDVESVKYIADMKSQLDTLKKENAELRGKFDRQYVAYRVVEDARAGLQDQLAKLEEYKDNLLDECSEGKSNLTKANAVARVLAKWLLCGVPKQIQYVSVGRWIKEAEKEAAKQDLLPIAHGKGKVVSLIKEAAKGE